MKYRLYCLTNYYLSSLQKGLQTAHVVSELANRAVANSAVKKVFESWASDDRTIIILNGGNSAKLQSFQRFLVDSNCPWPWAAFSEDEASLGGAMTAVGVILPESVYTNSSEISPEETVLASIIGTSSLAS